MTFRTNRRWGFTAVEVAMVATVIAILALLILPIFRQRAADARRVAADDELQSIVKALLLIEADVGDFLPRLNDLDNPDNEPPYYKWNPNVPANPNPPDDFWVALNAQQRATLLESWRGPYAAVKTYAWREELDGTGPGAFLDPTVQYGPVFFDPNPNIDDFDERYPLDPWGTPYILFGPETNYNVRAVYSLGPDRVPGSPAGPTQTGDYIDRDLLGSGDDHEFLF